MKVYTVGTYTHTGYEYGGPEEGGWGFHTYERTSVQTFTSAEEAAAYEERIIAEAAAAGDDDTSTRYEEWDVDGTLEDPTYPLCCHSSGEPVPHVPASVDVAMPPSLPASQPHYC